MKNFRLKLKELREERKITQKEIADELNVSDQMISKYENNVKIPNLERLVQIAKILDVTLDELVEFKRIHDQYSDTLSKIE